MNPLLIVLDLDETLIYGVEQPMEGRPPSLMIPGFAIYVRPGARELIEFLHKNYRFAFWTSATEHYIHAILPTLLSSTAAPEFFWHPQQCTRRLNHETGETYFVKRLKKILKLGFHLERTVVIDDSPEMLEENYGNLIRVARYTGELIDDEFYRLMRFLPHLNDQDDVRPMEKRGWQTRQLS